MQLSLSVSGFFPIKEKKLQKYVIAQELNEPGGQNQISACHFSMSREILQLPSFGIRNSNA
ncbi:hypothetical protein [Methanosarcina acetivorans]|uniref:hypothetical protein n=1 Tax=Methanosarcina acetivorans TaxID=2214 RepID=UPI0012FF4C8F|nr:hypothetical protein [Methanosarcina acetivorans]